MANWNPWHGCTKISPGCANCYVRALPDPGLRPADSEEAGRKLEDPGGGDGVDLLFF